MTAGDGSAYTVTLDQVSQNINPGAYETPQLAGDHYAAAQFDDRRHVGQHRL